MMFSKLNFKANSLNLTEVKRFFWSNSGGFFVSFNVRFVVFILVHGLKDSDEELPYQPAPDSPTRTGGHQNSDDEDEEDPLDAFMSGIDNEVKQQMKEDKRKLGIVEPDANKANGSAKSAQTSVRADIEEEDVEESYYR